MCFSSSLFVSFCLILFNTLRYSSIATQGSRKNSYGMIILNFSIPPFIPSSLFLHLRIISNLFANSNPFSVLPRILLRSRDDYTVTKVIDVVMGPWEGTGQFTGPSAPINTAGQPGNKIGVLCILGVI